MNSFKVNFLSNLLVLYGWTLYYIASLFKTCSYYIMKYVPDDFVNHNIQITGENTAENILECPGIRQSTNLRFYQESKEGNYQTKPLQCDVEDIIKKIKKNTLLYANPRNKKEG